MSEQKEENNLICVECQKPITEGQPIQKVQSDESMNTSQAYGSFDSIAMLMPMPMPCDTLHYECAESKKNRRKIENLTYNHELIYKARTIASHHNLNWADTLQIMVLGLVDQYETLKTEFQIIYDTNQHLRKIQQENEKST